ncbi:phosphoglycerate kinase [Pseudooceanicola sp. MF1-13]|uniref:phosphoglycerate kinase n=1 Tax=Pseudooceanicola sp. MF1-13 TaxID=3379095 RepID=UPI0038915405
MDLPSIMDINVRGKRLLVRADLNVPVEAGEVTDATRITRFAKGMRPLLDRGARLVILTHFGRPEEGAGDDSFSVSQLRPALSLALGRAVQFAHPCTGPEVVAAAKALEDGEVLLCENLRYHEGETINDMGFAAELAKLGDIYVNDAFSVSHRAHASTDAVTNFLPSVAGPLVMEEVGALTSALEVPARPSVAIVGGSKVSTKISVLENLAARLDHLIIGGGMANTFLFADGAPMGQSLHEADQIDTIARIRAVAGQSGCQIHLPTDVVVARDFAAHAPTATVAATACLADAMILDAGPRSVSAFREVLENCRTILWNGPLGAFEIEPFDRATVALANTAARCTANGATSVAGGGDTVAALNRAGVTQDFSYVSTAGGAFLEWLEGKQLPGIAALMRADKAA